MNDSTKELLSVTTLRKRLEDGPLSLEEASATLDQIAEAVDSAHSRGLMHGAITPENILLLPGGRARLLSGKTGTEHSHRLRRARRHGLMSGSPYISPEEVRGDAATLSTDVWALGALLYEMLTARPPFTAFRTTILHELVAESDAEPLTDHSSHIQDVLDRALAKWPANRHGSAQALANAFWQALPHQEGTTGHGGAAQGRTPRRLHTAAERTFVQFNQAVNRPLQLGGAPPHHAHPVRRASRGSRLLRILGGFRQPPVPSAD